MPVRSVFTYGGTKLATRAAAIKALNKHIEDNLPQKRRAEIARAIVKQITKDWEDAFSQEMNPATREKWMPSQRVMRFGGKTLTRTGRLSKSLRFNITISSKTVAIVAKIDPSAMEKRIGKGRRKLRPVSYYGYVLQRGWMPRLVPRPFLVVTPKLDEIIRKSVMRRGKWTGVSAIMPMEPPSRGLW